MTVGELKQIIADMDDDTPIRIDIAHDKFDWYDTTTDLVEVDHQQEYTELYIIATIIDRYDTN